MAKERNRRIKEMEAVLELCRTILEHQVGTDPRGNILGAEYAHDPVLDRIDKLLPRDTKGGTVAFIRWKPMPPPKPIVLGD
jgi:hypothetical protein